MLQQILVAVMFLGALAFLASLLIQNLRAKEGCVSGCGKCSVDTSKINVGVSHSATSKR